MTVTAPAWADNRSFRPNPGQFPIRVERHLNSFVGNHLPGVTTVTTGTRYYALHGLIAQLSHDEGMDEASTIDLLRRSEALLAYVTWAHSRESGHDPLTPQPHGIDAILRGAGTEDGVDLPRAADQYSQVKWAFSNPYRGSEQTLKILSPGGFKPGDWYDPEASRSVLGRLVDVARRASALSRSEALALASACLCSTPEAPDGRWLAELLSGDAAPSAQRLTVGGLLWQFGHMVGVACGVGDVTGADSFGDIVMYDPAFHDHFELQDQEAPLRWRGALLRRESVYAWRLIWRHLSSLVGGARPVDELVDAFADGLPSVAVGKFFTALPATSDPAGRPRPAERELDDLPELQRWLARVMIGSRRLDDLQGPELIGFRGRQEDVQGVWQELSPGWVADQCRRFSSRPLPDFARHLANVLVNRSQRVALQKARFNRKTGVFSYPARLRVTDGIAMQIYGETALGPATRIPQYLSITRQAGMLKVDSSGRFTIGPNGGRLV